MIEHDPHTGFIVAAYAVAALVILGMTVAIVADYRGLKKALARFGAQGTERE